MPNIRKIRPNEIKKHVLRVRHNFVIVLSMQKINIGILKRCM